MTFCAMYGHFEIISGTTPHTWTNVANIFIGLLVFTLRYINFFTDYSKKMQPYIMSWTTYLCILKEVIDNFTNLIIYNII